VLTNGSVGLSQDYGASVASALTISVLATEVSVATAYGAQSNGTLQMAISWKTGQQPAVTLNNLQNSPSSPATETSPTATSPMTKILTPGVPMPLTNITTEEDRLCRNW
jgi:hypothetical protein